MTDPRLAHWQVTDLTGTWLVEHPDREGNAGFLFEAEFYDREAAEMVRNALNSWERARQARRILAIRQALEDEEI
jgi:hypothetical protein